MRPAANMFGRRNSVHAVQKLISSRRQLPRRQPAAVSAPGNDAQAKHRSRFCASTTTSLLSRCGATTRPRACSARQLALIAIVLEMVEHLQTIQHEIVRPADLGRRVVSTEQMKEKHRSRLHLVT
jgi:hypothetical protein